MYITKIIPQKYKEGYFYQRMISIYTILSGLFHPYGYFRNYIFFPIIAFFRKNKIGRFYQPYKKLDDIKGRYSNKRCFIIASGPSLTQSDVEKLDGEVSIGLNRIYRMYEKTLFRPTFYMSLDPSVLKIIENEENPIDVNDFSKELNIFNMVSRKDLARYINEKMVFLPTNWQNHWIRASDKFFDYRKNLKYSDNLLWGIYDKYTVTCAAIEFAIHIGCQEIYLLGVDCNYMGKQKQFMETKADFSANDEQYERQAVLHTAAYEFLETEAKKRGISIYNATRGGALEVFERVDFDSLFD